MCIDNAVRRAQSPQPTDFLTATDVSTLKTFFDQQNAVDSREIESALMHSVDGKSAIEHFEGYVSFVTHHSHFFLQMKKKLIVSERPAGNICHERVSQNCWQHQIIWRPFSD